VTLGRRVATAVGVLAVATGFGVAALPGLAPAVTETTLAAIAVAAVAFVAGLHAASVRARRSARAPFRPGEWATPTPPPESDLVAALDDITGVPGPVETQARATVYVEVRALATETLERVEGCSPASARRRLNTGEWTDDPVAAAFFTDPAPTLTDRLRGWVTARPTFARRAIHALDGVARLDEAATPDRD